MGVRRILVPGIDFSSSQDAIKLCALYPDFLYAAIGMHPNTICDNFLEELQSIGKLASHPAVVAIGEVGLDYYRMTNPKSVQQRIFIDQLASAEEFNLPLCIHNRKAANDILDIIKKHKAKSRYVGKKEINGVFHSFSGDLRTARRIIELGFLLGISGPITYPKNAGLAEVVKEVGIQHLVIETDAPYLAPQKFRGQRNEPAYVVQIAEELSVILGYPIEKVSEITNKNAERLFQWGNKKSLS